MRKGWKIGAIAIFASLSLLTSGCNTKVIEHENQALKTELENVKKQLNDSKQKTSQVTEEKTKLEQTVSLLQSADVDQTLLPQLAYYMEKQARATYKGAYQTSITMFTEQNVDDVKKMVLTQYQHALASFATQEYIDGEVKRLQDAWGSKNPITFPNDDKITQLELKTADQNEAVVQATVARTGAVSPYNSGTTTDNLLMTITLAKTELGWKLKSTKVEPAPATPPPTTPPAAPAAPAQDKKTTGMN
ncbi:hypothetical protein [Aneurinibacillus tyrosinisolvens]|uniref:hypothetical protein n=1 Tax=Aneurinibacillus tyrosinisolvens TaxID=1443435 RepID=UPI00063F69EF|nr:hypothetical protein [Aneurinibacillus tyrosinisolvens]